MKIENFWRIDTYAGSATDGLVQRPKIRLMMINKKTYEEGVPWTISLKRTNESLVIGKIPVCICRGDYCYETQLPCRLNSCPKDVCTNFRIPQYAIIERRVPYNRWSHQYFIITSCSPTTYKPWQRLATELPPEKRRNPALAMLETAQRHPRR